MAILLGEEVAAEKERLGGGPGEEFAVVFFVLVGLGSVAAVAAGAVLAEQSGAAGELGLVGGPDRLRQRGAIVGKEVLCQAGSPPPGLLVVLAELFLAPGRTMAGLQLLPPGHGPLVLQLRDLRGRAAHGAFVPRRGGDVVESEAGGRLDLL